MIGGEGVPVERQPARVGDAGGILAADAVESAEEVGFAELGGGAAEFVPAAGVEDEEGAVGVFDDVGGVEVAAVTGDEEFYAMLESEFGIEAAQV